MAGEDLVDDDSRVAGAIGRGVEDAGASNAAGLWAAYEAYRERVEQRPSVPSGTDDV